MVWTPPKTYVDKRREKAKSFNIFLDLPDCIKDSLVWGVGEIRAGNNIGERDLAQYVIDHYDRNNPIGIGELMMDISRFVQFPGTNMSMVHCYVDYGCNDLAAKLAWREDYDVSV